MADRTIGELAEAPIGSLPSIADLYDDSLLAVEQQGEARKMTGEQWKKYAQAGVAVYVESAKEAAEDAEKAATEAETSAKTAKQYSGKPPVIQAGYWWTWDADQQKYVNTGKRSVLNFDRVYASVAAMNADKDNVEEMTTAIISSTVDDPDNAAIFIFNDGNWNFLADLSGFTGVGIQSITLTSGDHSPGTTDVYTILCTDGSSYEFSVLNGPKGDKGDKGDPGTSFTVLGRYDTLEELKAAHPTGSEGEAWAVGSAEDNTIYLWNVDTQEWDNIGSLQGAPGQIGATFTPSVSGDGELNWTNNAGLPNPDPVNIKGPAGRDGAAGPAGKTAYQYAVDGGYTGTEAQFKALMGTGPWLPLSGGTITGSLKVKNPSDQEDAANKKYVDTNVETVPVTITDLQNCTVLKSSAWKTGSVVNIVVQFQATNFGIISCRFNGDFGPSPMPQYHVMPCPVYAPSTGGQDPIYAYLGYAGEWVMQTTEIRANQYLYVHAQIPYFKA